MLPQENRLRKKKDFQSVVQKGKAFREQGLLLKLGPASWASTELSSAGRPASPVARAPRIGIVVSKKVAKQAVRRNRIRRLIREAVQKELHAIKNRARIAFIVLPEFQLTESGEVEKVVHRLFRRASLFQ